MEQADLGGGGCSFAVQRCGATLLCGVVRAPQRRSPLGDSQTQGETALPYRVQLVFAAANGRLPPARRPVQAGVLLAIRDRVLCSLAQRMPPEMQLLEALLAAPDYSTRLALMREADGGKASASSGRAGSSGGRTAEAVGAAGSPRPLDSAFGRAPPACDVRGAVVAATSLIEEIEDNPQLPDRCGLVAWGV